MRTDHILSADFDETWSPETAARFLLSVVLVLSIVLPTVFQPMKAVLLLVILALVLRGMLANQLQLSVGLYCFSLLYALLGLAWSVYGEIVGAPGAMAVLTVMLLYPLLVPLFTLLYRQEHNQSLFRIFLLCAWIIGVGDLLFVVTGSLYPGNLLQIALEALYGDWAVVDNAQDYLKFTLPNVSSVIFLLPFFLTALVFSESRKGKLGIFVAVLLLIIVAILSGRRALLLSTLLGPAIAVMGTLGSGRDHVGRKVGRWWMWGCAALVAFGLTYVAVEIVGVEYYLSLLGSIFDFKENASNLERVYQFDALMRGIVDAPALGQGAGAVADYVRSDETPWAYELFYVAFVFQYGIVGFLLYACGVAYLCWSLISIIRRVGRASFEFYFLSGFIAFILATGSNPYLSKFDYMWILFVPYAIVNLKLVSANNTGSLGFHNAH
jgi:hypothetical protein